MIISLIAAADLNNVIGKDNDLPWKLPKDMRFFMRTTKGHHVIMGRKNYESIPGGALKNRTNIVLTRNPNYTAERCEIVSNLDDALTIARNNHEEEAFIIGGAEIYKLALPIAHCIYLTQIHHKFDGDTFFPKFDVKQWKLATNELFLPDANNKYSFSFNKYERIQTI